MEYHQTLTSGINKDDHRLSIDPIRASASIRLNSSKHAQPPEAARPAKITQETQMVRKHCFAGDLVVSCFVVIVTGGYGSHF